MGRGKKLNESIGEFYWLRFEAENLGFSVRRRKRIPVGLIAVFGIYFSISLLKVGHALASSKVEERQSYLYQNVEGETIQRNTGVRRDPPESDVRLKPAPTP